MQVNNCTNNNSFGMALHMPHPGNIAVTKRKSVANDVCDALPEIYKLSKDIDVYITPGFSTEFARLGEDVFYVSAEKPKKKNISLFSHIKETLKEIFKSSDEVVYIDDENLSENLINAVKKQRKKALNG